MARCAVCLLTHDLRAGRLMTQTRQLLFTLLSSFIRMKVLSSIGGWQYLSQFG